MSRLAALFRLLISDEKGQDLLEYAMLAGIIGVASLLAYTTIPPKMETAFRGWGGKVYNLWEPQAPVSTP